MKKIVPFALLTIIFSCQNKPAETMTRDSNANETASSYPDSSIPDVGKLDTTNYTGPDNLKQGKWIEFRDGMKSGGQYSKKLREGKYNNSKKTGVWTEYDEHELVKSKTTYVDDKPEGYAAMYDNAGNITREGNYKDGIFVENKK